MDVHVGIKTLHIDLSLLEAILSFKRSWGVPLAHVTDARTGEPAHSWRDLRAPGTYLPGVMRSGTYYTPRGKEFWCVMRGKEYLTVELKGEKYSRLVLGVEDSDTLARKIHRAIGR